MNYATLKYDIRAIQLLLLEMSVSLDHNWMTRGTQIPCIRGAISNSKKAPKLEKQEMAPKICGEKYTLLGMVWKCNMYTQDFTKSWSR